MFITGNVALAYVGLTLLDARLYQVSAKHSLETQIRDGKTAQKVIQSKPVVKRGTF
jgi:hypothetical protein